MSDFIYLDHAAATPVDERVFEAMRPYFADVFYNPSATYLPARKVAQDIIIARQSVAHHLGARSSEIIFTAGGTEANNLAIRGVMEQYPDGNVVVSAIEHESVLAPAKTYDYRTVPVKPDGTIDLEALQAKIDEKTILVSVIYAQNEVGTVQSLRQIAAIVAEKRKERSTHVPLYFHTDAAQAANYLDLHVSSLGVDMMTLNGGKMYGPKQSGILFVKTGVTLVPQILGGGQEWGKRSGTENVAGIVGFATALDLAIGMRHEESKRLYGLQQLFLQELKAALPTVVINGSLKRRLPNNIHITLPGQDNERLLIKLESEGVLCAAGSACSASKNEPSHVLRALGISDADARASLRLTMGRSTEESMIHTVVQALTKLVSE